MTVHRWRLTLAGLAVLLGLGHAPLASAGAADNAPEVLGVRAAVHRDAAEDAAPRPAVTIERNRIVFDLAAPRPGAARAIRIERLPDEAVSGWKVHLNMPLSARAAAQIRALPRSLSGVEIDLYQSGTGEPAVLAVRFRKPTVLARHFVLPGRRSQEERLVLDFVPDSAPAYVLSAPATAEAVLAPLAAGDGVALAQTRQKPESQPQPAAPPEAAPGQPTAQTPDTPTDTRPGAFEPGVFEAKPEADGSRDRAGPARSSPLGVDDRFPPPPTGNSPLTLWGYFEAEGRLFPQNSRDGVSEHLIGSMAMEPTIEYAWADGNQFLRFTGFARVDTVTESRTHADIREAKWVGVFGPLELTVGVDRRFWGVTESVHLVNIINQVDTLEDVDFEDFLGQPLIAASYTTKFGTFSGFFMPYFRERRFPHGKDRPNLPVRVERGLTQYESGDNNWHPDWAVRWSLRQGPIDLGISHFSGFAREPRLLLNFDEGGRPFLVPRYDLIDQTGIDLQATFGALLLKFEGIHQWNPVRNYAAFAAGFEYTFYGVSAGGADLGVLAEYLYDERGKGRQPAPGIPPFSNVSPYDNDLFLGLRWSGNDVATTEILGGAILDLDTKSKAFIVEASRRLGSNLRISLDGRFFTSVSSRDVLYPLGDDDFIQLKIQWHF